MTALLNFGPIALAILCYVLAGVFKVDPGAHDGLLVLAGSLAGLAVPRLGDMFKREKLGPPSSSTPVVALLVLGTALLLASPARAEAPQALGCLDTANTYCVVPVAAVGWQINLKTGGAANAVSLVGLTLQHTFGSLPMGLGVYGGLGASSANRGSYQGCIGASITSWGLLCGGVQRIAGEPVWQGMVTFAPQLTFGGTPSYVQAKGGGQ